MSGDADVAAAAALIGEPARAALLSALLAEEALPARELAARARVAPSTASEHLAKLVAGKLVVGERDGRHRYFRLADPAVAAAIEALAAIAPAKPVRSLREAAVGHAIRYARTCYDHLAGHVGVELTRVLERDGVLVLDDDAYRLGASAPARLENFGIDPAELAKRRRAFARPCLDWSERRSHLAGALGAALTESVEVTAAGRVGLRLEFGLDA